jgi:hypothetical protein
VVAITAFLFFITSGFTILWVAGIASLGTYRTTHNTRTTRHAYALLTHAFLHWRAIGGAVVLLHAALRQPSLGSKVSSFLDHFSPDGTGQDPVAPFQDVSEAIQVT